jgi:NTP pyrophosphatase (non-canonical NTP hydrolase)
MTFQARCRAFLARHGLSHTPQIHILDLVSEVGELAKALLEDSDYGESPSQSTPALEEELGDVFFSLIALAESLNVDLEAALDKAFVKYEARMAAKGHCGSRDEPAGTTE